MLNILVTERPDDTVVRGIDWFFDEVWKPEWIETEFSRQLIADIDRATVINGVLINSPFMGMISPKDLAGGTKRVLCAMYYDFGNDLILSVSNAGDNCAKWLQRVGAEKDVNLQTEVLMLFEDSEHWPIRVVNSNTLTYSWDEYRKEYRKAKCEEYRKYG